MRFVALVFSVLVVCFLAFTTIRFWGLKQSFVPFDHPLLNQKPPLALVEIEKLEDAATLSHEGDQVVMVLPLHLTADGQIIVMKDSTWTEIQKTEKFQIISSHSQNPKTKIQYFDLADLLDMSPGIHNLEGFLQGYPQNHFVFVINDNTENIQTKTMEVVQKDLPKGSISVASQIEAVIKSSKDIRPLTAFSMSLGEQIRLLSFESVGLLPSLQINGDFVYSPIKWKDRDLVDEGLVAEMHRRFKKVFLGPLVNAEELKQAQSLNADGYIFPDVLTYQNSKNLIRF